MSLKRTAICVSATIGALTLSTTAALAVPLTGSGAHLPIPPNGIPAFQARALSNIIGNSSFDGTWSAPVASPWLGTFNANGPIPNGPTITGQTVYTFGGLTSGVLPTGTYFIFTDVDLGAAQNEDFTLSAFDSNGLQITTPWLDGPIGASGITGGGGPFVSTDMPGWAYSAGVYDIFGNTAGSNPSVNIALASNVDIGELILTRGATSANFLLAAPVPAPGGLAIGVIALPALVRRRRI